MSDPSISMLHSQDTEQTKKLVEEENAKAPAPVQKTPYFCFRQNKTVSATTHGRCRMHVIKLNASSMHAINAQLTS